MQTADWVKLQQWDCACRALMQLHPWNGMSLAAMMVEGRDAGLRPGWNRIVRDEHAQDREVYIFIGDGEGKTTTIRPNVDTASIHDAQDTHPDPEHSALWTVAARLGADLAESKVIDPSEQARIAQAIERAAQDLRDMERMFDTARAMMERMRQAVFESRGGAIKHADFLKPADDLVKSYLAFELPGKLASEVLGVILSTQCTLPLLGPPETMPSECRMAALEHLADTTYDLLTSRQTRNVRAYFEMTYLAGIYAGGAMRMATWAQPSGRHTPAELDRISKLCLNLDELHAHSAGMTFLLPALLPPRALLSWVMNRARATAQTVTQVADFYNLYPGLRALLEPDPKFLDMSDAEVNEAYKQYSDSRLSFDSDAGLKDIASPVAKANRKKIMTDFLKIGFGQAGFV